jgi:hypothetical protein
MRLKMKIENLKQKKCFPFNEEWKLEHWMDTAVMGIE